MQQTQDIIKHKHKEKCTKSKTQSKHRTEFSKLDPPKGLHENISRVFATWDVSDRNVTLFNMVAYPMISAVHMFHC